VHELYWEKIMKIGGVELRLYSNVEVDVVEVDV